MTNWKPPRGTRDYLPKETKQRNKLISKMRSVFESYGYGEVITPAFESFELLAKKTGPEIEQEIYSFEDKSGRKLGLRFDPTVPIARIVASNPSLTKPIKFYYITRMWRYERPQAGRYREFWQAGLELIGSKTTDADAEVVQVANDLLKKATDKEFVFKINSRKVIEEISEKAGISKDKKEDAFRAIDKLAKIGEKEVKKEMIEKGISKEQADKFFELIEKKEADINELIEIKNKLEEKGIENVEIDLTVVRGLSYYTGFVFETFIKEKQGIGSVCSGGRYDNLIKLYGGEDLPAVGFGLGIDRLLDAIGYEEEYFPALVYIANVSEEVKKQAEELASKLRVKGISVETDLMNRNLRKQLDYASKKNIPFVVIIGKKDLENKQVTIRNMKTGEEEKVKLGEVEDYFLMKKDEFQ